MILFIKKIILFNLTQQGEGDILVLSPFSQFMATSLSQTNSNISEYGKGIRDWCQIMQANILEPINIVHLMLQSIILDTIPIMVVIIITIQKKE